jgi:hypothetical protein
MSELLKTDPSATPIHYVTYGHRARPYSNEAVFELREDRVAIEQGSRKGDFLFSEIAMIRLMYKPKNTTNEGYQTKIYRRDRKTASFTNLSWKSLVDVDRQDEAYSLFLRKMITAAAGANPSIVLMAGLPGWMHMLVTVFAVASVAALAAVTVQAMLQGGWPIALLTAALASYFTWWAMRYVGRNRPRAFRPDAIPAHVLPPLSGSEQASSSSP